MIYIVRGDLSLPYAFETGRLEALGASRARRALADWLNLSPLANVRSQRAAAAE